MCGTSSNVILLIIIICNKDMRTLPNIFILNLAISDITYLIARFFEALAKQNIRNVALRWLYVQVLSFLLSVGLSASSVAVPSIQRYNVTVNPFHNRLSSQPAWRVTEDTICSVDYGCFFRHSFSPLKECMFRMYDIRTYYKMVVLSELCVLRASSASHCLRLRHDCLPSCE